MRILALSIAALPLVSGCSNMSIDEFSDSKPELRLEEYFAGHTRAWGLFEDRFGNVRREFVVDIDGEWDGEQLTLTEDFVYNDGERERRVWVLEKTGEDTWSGTTDNVVGIATGRSSGNAFNWRYSFNLEVDDSTWKVQFDDWMFLQEGGVLLNKATVTRWGIKIGTVFLSFRRVEEKATVSKLKRRSARKLAAAANS